MLRNCESELKYLHTSYLNCDTLLTHDSAKNVQKAVIASVNFDKKVKKNAIFGLPNHKNGSNVTDDSEQRR